MEFDGKGHSTRARIWKGGGFIFSRIMPNCVVKQGSVGSLQKSWAKREIIFLRHDILYYCATHLSAETWDFSYWVFIFALVFDFRIALSSLLEKQVKGHSRGRSVSPKLLHSIYHSEEKREWWEIRNISVWLLEYVKVVCGGSNSVGSNWITLKCQLA